LRNILALRRLKNDEINESYIFFCENFLKCVVGSQTFNKGWKHGVALSDLASPSDEAFALLLIDNSEARWLSEHEKKPEGEDVIEQDKLVLPKYTSGGPKETRERKKGLTKRYGGWNEPGIIKFNELVRAVREDRLINGEWFDKQIQERIRNANSDGNDTSFDMVSRTIADNDFNFKPAGKVDHVAGKAEHSINDEQENVAVAVV
jgi:hypothetical protein